MLFGITEGSAWTLKQYQFAPWQGVSDGDGTTKRGASELMVTWLQMPHERKNRLKRALELLGMFGKI